VKGEHGLMIMMMMMMVVVVVVVVVVIQRGQTCIYYALFLWVPNKCSVGHCILGVFKS